MQDSRRGTTEILLGLPKPGLRACPSPGAVWQVLTPGSHGYLSAGLVVSLGRRRAPSWPDPTALVALGRGWGYGPGQGRCPGTGTGMGGRAGHGGWMRTGRADPFFLTFVPGSWKPLPVVA